MSRETYRSATPARGTRRARRRILWPSTGQWQSIFVLTSPLLLVPKHPYWFFACGFTFFFTLATVVRTIARFD